MAIGTSSGRWEVNSLESFQWDCRLGSFRVQSWHKDTVTSGRRNVDRTACCRGAAVISFTSGKVGRDPPG